MVSRSIVLVLGVVSPCVACATTSVRRDATCELVPTDSQYLLGGPVYRDCAVDQQAKQEGRAIFPEDFEPRMSLTDVTDQCYRVDLEFVVDTTGIPEGATARVVRSNHPEYADAVIATLPRWRYRPARRDGVLVRQIVREGRAMAVRVVAVGSAYAGRASRPPRC